MKEVAPIQDWKTTARAQVWFASTDCRQDIDDYYHQAVMRLGRRSIVSRMAKAIYYPKIFEVMRPVPVCRFVAIDAWIRMMWAKRGLPRWIREAIAVTVSKSNDCEY